MSFKVALIYAKRLTPDQPDPELMYKEFEGENEDDARLKMYYYIKEIAQRVFHRGVNRYVIVGGQFERLRGTSDIFVEIDRITSKKGAKDENKG